MKKLNTFLILFFFTPTLTVCYAIEFKSDKLQSQITIIGGVGCDNVLYSNDNPIKKSDFSCVLGVGVIEGIRFGLRYHISNDLSSGVYYGIAPFMFMEVGHSTAITADMNYLLNKETNISFCPSLSLWSRIDGTAVVVTPNLGYYFNHNNPVQFRIGYGILFEPSINKYRASTGILNIDINVKL